MSTQLSEKYQKKSDIQHILDNPDTYIGSVETVMSPQWVVADATDAADDGLAIVKETISFNPGLFKLFDEGIVNCRDHVVRMLHEHKAAATAAAAAADTSTAATTKLVTYIHIDVNQATGEITMENDGNGIDVAMHPEHQVWIPELIFSQPRTSTNYQKTLKTVGGKNGYGFKLVVIWSTMVRVETVDHIRKLRYVQYYRDNCTVIEPPTITPIKGSGSSIKPFTKITFLPDYRRLGYTDGKLTNDMFRVFHKRVIDIAAMTSPTDAKKKSEFVHVCFNGQPIAVRTFREYTHLYLGGDAKTSEIPRVHEKFNDHWEVVVAMNTEQSEFNQVSFVNGICTFKGGRHVDHVANQLCALLVKWAEKQQSKKNAMPLKPPMFKQSMWVFVRCDIECPSFDSQTKEFLTTSVNAFGTKCEIPEGFAEKVAKMGIVDHAMSWARFKESSSVSKQLNRQSGKKSNVRVDNYISANWAGTPNQSKECTLFLTEGLSAKSGLVSGFTGKQDADRYGVFPLKGKLINARKESDANVFKNTEIQNVMKILGLKVGQTFDHGIEDVYRHLRYGSVCMVTDQDLDGSHIRGLLLNLFDSKWRSLMRIEGFLRFMLTPLLRATLKSNEEQALFFYSMGEFEEWVASLGENGGQVVQKRYDIKYFKGLGTSTKAEWKMYMANPRFVNFVYTGDDSTEMLEMAFGSTKVEDRKAWIRAFDRQSFLDTSQSSVTIQDFVNKDLRHFSHSDCERSLPHALDGLKTSTRKILYACLKKNVTREIKVANLPGIVAAESEYHHGEDSLKKAVVCMAQNFVGSNNIWLLEPCGQFGTRMENGHDDASDRYIFTKLSKWTRCIFRPEDDAILERETNDQNQWIEPKHYLPVIPMLLVNGSDGIGTGFSCKVPPFNPRELIQCIRQRLMAPPASPEFPMLNVFYRGYKGSVEPVANTDGKYVVKALYHWNATTRELVIQDPLIGVSFKDYKEFLEKMEDGELLDSLSIQKDDATFHATMILSERWIHEVLSSGSGNSSAKKRSSSSSQEAPDLVSYIEKQFKLSMTVHTTNMYAWDSADHLTYFENISHIFNMYYDARLEGYKKRKAVMLRAMDEELDFLRRKYRFVMMNVRKELDTRGLTKKAVKALLVEHQLAKLVSAATAADVDEEDLDKLMKIDMWGFTEENARDLSAKVQQKEQSRLAYEQMTISELWLQDLAELEAVMNQVEEDIQRAEEKVAKQLQEGKSGGKNALSNAVAAKKRTKGKSDSEAAAAAAAASAPTPKRVKKQTN